MTTFIVLFCNSSLQSMVPFFHFKKRCRKMICTPNDGLRLFRRDTLEIQYNTMTFSATDNFLCKFVAAFFLVKCSL